MMGAIRLTVSCIDPLTGMWTNIGDLNGAQFLYTAVVLLSGKVLIFGGKEVHIVGRLPIYLIHQRDLEILLIV